MPPPTRDDWRLVPDAIVDADRRQTEASDWASAARAEVAQQWGDQARAEVNAGSMAEPTLLPPSPVETPSSPAPAPLPAPDAPAPLSFTPTTAEISGAAQGSGRIGDRERSIMSGAAETASWLGAEGQKALQAILVTEGGMSGAVGDTDRSKIGSHGPLQFYGGGGQLNNFAAQHNMSLDAAAAYVKAHPMEAIQWAVGTPEKPGYIGQAIQRGLNGGLSGPDLATYAQRTGQVSESPERAGNNYRALFGGGAPAITGAPQLSPGLPSDVNAGPRPVTPAAAPSVDFGSVVQQARDAVGGAVSGAAENVTQAATKSFTDVVTEARNALGTLGQGFDQIGRNITQTNPDQAAVEQRFAGASDLLPKSPLEAAGAGLGAPTGGEIATEQRNRAIEQGNPLKDVPVIGGATTFAAQAALDPTNLMLAAAPGVLRGAGRAAEAAAEVATGPEAQALLRARQRGEGLNPVGAIIDAVSPPATEPHGLTINLPKYIPEEVQQVIRQAYDANPEVMDAARRGVLPDEAVRDLANQVGQSPAQITARWKPGQAKNAETILALREGLNSASQEVIRAQRALQSNPSSADALNSVAEALTKHAAIQEAVTGVTAEAGRALRQFRQPVTGQQFALRQIQRVAKATNMTPEELAGHLADVDLVDPAKVANLARTLTTHTFGDKLSALWYFSLLSSPVTHIKNTVSNAIVLASRPVESTASAVVDVGRAALTRSPRERYFGEVPAQLAGMQAGLTDGVRGAYQILRRGYSEAELASKPELATAEAFQGRLADLTVNAPGRALRASDVFFRSLNKTASLYGDAYRMASREGLKGQEFADEMARLIADPTKEMLDRAEKEAAYRVFQQDGTFVRQMGQLRNESPALRFLLPFIQTPYNIAKYALERTPLGAGKLLTEMATPGGRATLRAKGAGDFSDRVARASLGSATLYALTEYARQGNLTGAAPIDQTERDAFARQGKQAYSMRNPVTGEWFSYAGLQPFTTIFAAAAEIEKMQRTEPGKLPPDLLTGVALGSLALGRATLDQPWTDGLAEFLDFMSGSNVRDGQDLADAAGKYAARQSRVLVPAVVRWLASASDPSIREPERGAAGIPQTIASGIPGLQDSAPTKLNAFGRPSPRPVSGLQTLNPFAASQPTSDTVEQELARLELRGYDVQPGYVGKTATVAMADRTGRPDGSEEIELGPAERRRYQEAAGTLAYEFLADEMASPEWAKQDNAGKARIINRLIDNARRMARAQMADNPAIQQRATEARQRTLVKNAP